MSALLADITPIDMGLPAKYREFRAGQLDAIEWGLTSPKPYLAANAPTGTGKSVMGIGNALASGSRAVYLTATRGLEDQITADFSTVGLVDVRGKANYPCSVYTKLRTSRSCDYGHEQGCSLSRTTACPYQAAVAAANSKNLVSTNYSYWLHARQNSTNALAVDKPVEMLICDEAHSAFDELARFLQITLSHDELNDDAELKLARLKSLGSGLMNESSAAHWRSWAERKRQWIAREMLRLRSLYQTLAAAKQEEGEYYASLEESRRKTKAILAMDENWVWEMTEEGVSFDVIWPGRYANLLWSGVPRILLLSATLRPYTLALLGIAKDKYDFREFKNDWPPNRGLVYYLPTVRLNYRSTPDDYRQIAAMIDRIIESRRDRKGIIHTVSYDRMRLILSFSRYAHCMFYNHSSRESAATADRFRRADPPAVLISPSFATGWDFAYDQCEYQIISKVPFPHSESRVMKERFKDEKYRTYITMFEIIQMIGRGRRAHDDRCETFILDKSLPIVLAKGRKFAPKDFKVHRILEIPRAPEKIHTPLLQSRGRSHILGKRNAGCVV